MTALEHKRGFLLYRRLARLAFAKPSQVIELKERAVSYVDSDLVPRIIGVVGTAYRKSGQDERATRMLRLAEQLARKVPIDRLGLGDILQRRAFTLSDQGDYSGALALTREALEIYETYGGRADKGRALVDLGIFYQRQQRYRRALDTNAAALENLPERERDNRLAAMRNCVYCCTALGDRQAAVIWATNATKITGVTPLLRGEALEMRAELLLDDGNALEASKAYRSAVELYTESELWVDTAVATIQLCRALQLAGENREAQSVACMSIELYGRLPSHVAKAAITELACEARAGRQLDEVLLTGLLKKIRATR